MLKVEVGVKSLTPVILVILTVISLRALPMKGDIHMWTAVEMRGAEGGGAEQGTPLLVVKEEMSGCVTPPGSHHHTERVSNPGCRRGKRALYQGG